MSIVTFPPPFVPAHDAVSRLVGDGYAVLDGAALATLIDVSRASLDTLVPSWSNLAPDTYLRDGGSYRQRRHASYVLDDAVLVPVAHRAHWQPIEYNALHGGMRRWFEPVTSGVAISGPWRGLLLGLGSVFARARGEAGTVRWSVEAHQFRIDTAGGIGRPTPEGAHRDGVDFVAVLLIGRRGVKGGETRVFEANGPAGSRFTMLEPWTTLLLDDTRVIHETTPVQPVDDRGRVTDVGARDTLVVTYRAGGFQGDDRIADPGGGN